MIFFTIPWVAFALAAFLIFGVFGMILYAVQSVLDNIAVILAVVWAVLLLVALLSTRTKPIKTKVKVFSYLALLVPFTAMLAAYGAACAKTGFGFLDLIGSAAGIVVFGAIQCVVVLLPNAAEAHFASDEEMDSELLGIFLRYAVAYIGILFWMAYGVLL